MNEGIGGDFIYSLSLTPFTKIGSYNSTSLQDKTMMSDHFELEDEMDPTSSVTFSTSLREARIAEQASICVYKDIHVLKKNQWPIISLNKTLIHRLASFAAL